MPSDDPPRLVCGLDLGGTKLLGVVLDADAPFDVAQPESGVLAEHRVPTPHDGVEALAAALADIVATLRAEATSKLGGDLTAVGLGAPGLVDRDGVMHTGPNLPGITRFGFAQRLRTNREKSPMFAPISTTVAPSWTNGRNSR